MKYELSIILNQSLYCCAHILLAIAAIQNDYIMTFADPIPWDGGGVVWIINMPAKRELWHLRKIIRYAFQFKET